MILLLVALVTAASACVADTAHEPSNPDKEERETSPTIADPSKADSLGASVVPVVELRFGEEVRGTFVEDEQLDGYWFSVDQGVRITLEITDSGTDEGLDTVLFLYGPANVDRYFGPEAITVDDDGGWGLRSKIDDFEIPADGDYMVVVGGYAGDARGDYRLTLECAGNCPPGVHPPTADAGGDGSDWPGDAGTDVPVDPDGALLLDVDIRDIWARPLSDGECTLFGAGVDASARGRTTVRVLETGAITARCSGPDHRHGTFTVRIDSLSAAGVTVLSSDGILGVGLDVRGGHPTLHIGLQHDWFASTGPPPRPGTHARFLMDGEELWDLVAERILAATDTVHISTWWWESDFEMRRMPEILNRDAREPNTVMALLDATSATKRVLVWDHFAAGLFNADWDLRQRGATDGDGFEYLGQDNPTRGRFTWQMTPPDFHARLAEALGALPNDFSGPRLSPAADPREVDLTDLPIHLDIPLASYHQKFWVFDGDEAVISGMNVKLIDWDTNGHAVFDHRRMRFSSATWPRRDVDQALLHPDTPPRKDYGIYLQGPAAADAEAMFHRRWDLAISDDVQHAENATSYAAPSDIAPVPGRVEVQVVATLPEPFYEYAIYESHLNAIRNAREYIFIEDQYWRAPFLVDAIMERMAEVPGLQLIVVTMPVSDWTDAGCYWTYETNRRLRTAFAGRYHLFQARAFAARDSVVLDEEAPPLHDTEGVFVDISVHSKLMIVDDVFVSVGSCNKNTRGYVYEAELNANVLDAPFATAARERVVANLLGVDFAPSDWVGALQDAAAENDATWENWDDRRFGIDLYGAPLPAEYRVQGFVYSLDFDDPSECLIESIGPDITSEGDGEEEEPKP